ncbi:MAG: DUF4124 domain-containing protein [Betaproteobacteria bacterium]
MQRQLITVNLLLQACVFGASLVALPATAETYKWTDAEGKVHYSDQPPPANAKEQATVKARKQPAPATPAQKDGPPAKARTYIEQEAEFKKRQVETAEREATDKKKAEEATERKRNCEQVRAQLKGMQAGGRVTQTNAQGEREYMSDAQIAQEMERLKKEQAASCK